MDNFDNLSLADVENIKKESVRVKMDEDRKQFNEQFLSSLDQLSYLKKK